MSTIGVVRGARVGEGYRSGKQVLILDCEIDDPEDVQSVEYLFPSGDSFIPPNGDTVLIHEVGNQLLVATAVNSGVVSTISEAGERSLFAYKDGTVTALIDLLHSGEIVLNRGDGFAIEFEKMKNAFDEIVEFVNSHDHPFVGLDVGVAGKTGSVLAPSTADMSGAKVESVRLGG